MDNQGNNMFNNMIQPNVVPEVKDSNSNAQVGVFNNLANATSVSDNSSISLNQMNNSVQNDGGVFGNNDSLSNGLNDMFSNVSTDTNQSNNSFINNSNLVNSSVDSSSNMVGSIPSNANELSFVVPVESSTNNLVQPELQPVNTAMDFNVGSTTSSVVNNNVGDSLNASGLNEQNNVGMNTMFGAGTDNASNNSLNVANEVKVSDSKTEEIVSVKTYLINLLIFCIPVVGMIMLIIKALDKKESSIRNLARAQLLLSAILVLVGVVLTIVSTLMLRNLIFNLFG